MSELPLPVTPRIWWTGRASLLVRSDSVVALALGSKLASGTPALNFIAAELALELEAVGANDMTLAHLQGAWNTLAGGQCR